MATLVLYQSNANWQETNYYEDQKIDANSTGWFQITDDGIVFSQLSGSGITYNTYSSAVLGTMTTARSINESGDTNWLITGIGVAASDTSDLNYALRTGNAFTDDMVNIILSGNDAIVGTGGDDSFIYSAGTDWINGGAGVDTIDFSDYTYRGNYSNSLIVNLSLYQYKVTTNSNIVTTSTITNVENVLGSGYDDRITGNSSNNRLFGYSGDDIIYGGSGDDYINGGSNYYYDKDQLYGEDGNDFIVLGNGDTYIDGGSGSDTVSYFLMTKNVYIDLSLNLGKHGYYNNYYNTWDYEDTLLNVENVVGTAWNDTILGSSGNNTISGGAGNDSLNGGLGVDTLNYLTNGYNGVVVNLGANSATGQGTDAIYAFENVNGSNHNDTIIGNSLSNVLYGNGGNDILSGGAGIDTMIGGLGNDTYYIDNASDLTSETSTSATEIDTVISTVSQTLGANLERLTLNGTAAINGIGNILNNVLTGSAAANTLIGVAGNDTINGAAGNDMLYGGLGNDTLSGGAGIDNFVFDSLLNAATNRDTLVDFVVADDTIRLDRTVFNKLSTLGSLNAGQFCASGNGAAGDGNDYLLYNTSTGALSYDADGNGGGAAIQFATLSTKPTLSAADFVVVA